MVLILSQVVICLDIALVYIICLDLILSLGVLVVEDVVVDGSAGWHTSIKVAFARRESCILLSLSFF